MDQRLGGEAVEQAMIGGCGGHRGVAWWAIEGES